jgi:hypothetical protein
LHVDYLENGTTVTAKYYVALTFWQTEAATCLQMSR